jgi:hypothetical protein
MESERLGIEVQGTELWTGMEISFCRQTTETEPWMLAALTAKEHPHAIIASHVLSDCITRSGRIAEEIIREADATKDTWIEKAPEHMLPPLVEVKLWKPGPVSGEIEVCTVSGSPLVHATAVGIDGDPYTIASQPDMGVIGYLLQMALNDMGDANEWKILSFMTAVSDKMERKLPGGETVEANVIINEVACPVDPHADQQLNECQFYMSSYCVEIARNADGSLEVRDHTDAGASMQDMEDMGFASQSRFTLEAALLGYPLSLAASVILRLSAKPYQSMLDTAKSSVEAACSDSVSGMAFVAGLRSSNIGLGTSISDFVVPMMTSHYTDAASKLKDMLHVAAEQLGPPLSGGIESLVEQLEAACVAHNLFEWSLCALSNNLHLADQRKWKKLMRVMLSIEGTDA